MLLASVDYVRPASLAEATEALASNPDARPLAGGQSLINVLKHRLASVDLLVDISRLEELRFIRANGDGSVEVGAGVTYDELDRSTELRATHPKVADVAAGTVDAQVRNRGTLGGNICFNDPASNFPPLVVALGATLHVVGPQGERDVAAEDFFQGHYEVALEPGELLRSVTLPPLGDAGVGYSSIQVGGDSWAIARAASLVRVANGSVEEARLVLGCVGPVPHRLRSVEEALRGEPATPEAVAEATASAGDGLDPPGDVFASAEYRRALAPVVSKRSVIEAIEEGASV